VSCRSSRFENQAIRKAQAWLPAEDLQQVGEAEVKLKNGNSAHVTMHVLEGSKEEIEKQLKNSLEAFFEFYPDL
jgi:acyl carrier protein phosphodiesterase